MGVVSVLEVLIVGSFVLLIIRYKLDVQVLQFHLVIFAIFFWSLQPQESAPIFK